MDEGDWESPEARLDKLVGQRVLVPWPTSPDTLIAMRVRGVRRTYGHYELEVGQSRREGGVGTLWTRRWRMLPGSA